MSDAMSASSRSTPTRPPRRTLPDVVLRGWTRIAVSVLLTLGVLLARGKPAVAQEEGPVVIVGATVIDGTGAPPVADARVIVRGERIACVGEAGECPVPGDADTLDAAGRGVIPGLVDTHVHLFWDVESLLSRAEVSGSPPLGGVSDWLIWHVANGVTTIREASSFRLEDRTLALRAASELRDMPWPRIHVSGRVDEKSIDHYGAGDAAELARMQVERGVDALKIRRGLTLEDVLAVVRVADSASVPVWGHTYDSGDVDYTDEAVRGGISGVTHVDFLAPVSADHRPPEPDEPPNEENRFEWWLSKFRRWSYVDSTRLRRRIDGMVDHGAWLEPTLVASHFLGGLEQETYTRYADIACLAATWKVMRTGRLPFSDEERALYADAFEGAQRFVRLFHEKGGMLITGTDGVPVPGPGVHHELELLVDAGLSPMAALQAATRNAARALRREDRIGTVEAGKLADLLILEADPLEEIVHTREIWRVVKGGRVYDPARLAEVIERCD